MLASDLVHVPTVASLAVIVGIMAAAVIASLLRPKAPLEKKNEPPALQPSPLL